MRAMFYARLIRDFGTAQWVEQEVTTADEDILNGPRDSEISL